MDAWPFIVVYCRVPIWISLVAHYTLVRLCFFFIIIIHLYLGCLVFFVARRGYVFKGVHISYRTLIAGKVSCVCVCVCARQTKEDKRISDDGSTFVAAGTYITALKMHTRRTSVCVALNILCFPFEYSNPKRTNEMRKIYSHFGNCFRDNWRSSVFFFRCLFILFSLSCGCSFFSFFFAGS